MKTIQNILSTSQKFYEQSRVANSVLADAAEARRHTLRDVFSKNDIDSVGNWIEKTAQQSLINQKVPLFSNIPITDFALFAFKRCPNSNMVTSQKLNQAIFNLLAIPHAPVLPSLISNSKLPDGRNYLPSFGEVCLSLRLSNYQKFDYGYDVPTHQLETLEQSFFACHIIEYLENDLHKIGQPLNENLYLCRTFLKAVKFDNLATKIHSSKFGSTTVRQVIEHELETSTMNMHHAELENLLNTAYKNDVPLVDIVVEGLASLEDVLRMREDENLMHLFSHLSKKQVVNSVVKANEHKLDTSFNPNTYFDI